MSNIRITSPFSGGVTIIPNRFIEHYMLRANGEFVKIYLYLMHVSEHHTDFHLGQIADAMNCTESDVRRALKYWEKEGLITILPPNSRKMQALTFIMPTNAEEDAVRYAAQTESAAEQASAAYPSEADAQTAAAEFVSKTPVYQPLTAERVKQLKENEEIAELLFIAQQYLKKPLSPTETNKILYFYEGLMFTPDLIEYLIEYCVGKGHKSIHYIEKVAFAWKEAGYTTAKEAKEASEHFHKEYYTILKALGIRNRDPIEAEIAIMKNWMDGYGFSLELITEACTRTILATKQPSLQYADRILQNWKDAGVHTLTDIRKMDLAHEQSKNAKGTAKVKKQTSRFSNFEQRSYDYDSLESQLLNG